MALGNQTSNTTSLVRQQVYSDTVLLPLKDTLMSDALVHDLSDFKDGDTINVPILGEVTIHDRLENDDPKFDQVTTNRFTMTISKHKEAANYISLELMEDGYATKYLQSQIVPNQRRALMESYETSLLAVQSSQTAASLNTINGAPHRQVATGASHVISLEDFANAAYSLDMANIPFANRMAVIDPYSSLVLNKLTNITNVSNNKDFTGIINTGFRDESNFNREIYGFKIGVSNRLATISSETIDGVAASNAKALMFMSVADDQCKPIARAWRRNPMPQAKFNDDKLREEYRITGRWGVGLIRPDGLVVVLAVVPASGSLSV